MGAVYRFCLFNHHRDELVPIWFLTPEKRKALQSLKKLTELFDSQCGFFFKFLRPEVTKFLE
jgi:hypothetical protein